MFDLPNDGDYDRWLNVFTEASARATRARSLREFAPELIESLEFKLARWALLRKPITCRCSCARAANMKSRRLI